MTVPLDVDKPSPSGVLTYDGAGHTIYGDDDCIDDLVNDYLLELDLPDNGTTCPG